MIAKDFCLSVKAEILIMKEQNERIKLTKRQIKLVDFYNNHENESYQLKDSVLRQFRIIKKEL